MHPTIRRRLKTGIALSAYIVLLAMLFALVSAQPVTQTGPGATAVSSSSAPAEIAKPTWVDLRPQVITVHQAAPALSAQDLLANAQARLMNRIGATKLNLLTAFGPVRDGQVLTYVNGKILWQDPVTMHGAAPINNGTIVIDGTGRKPESFVEGNRHYSGGGGSAAPATVVSGGGGTGDLTQATADGRYVNISGDTMNGALVIAYDGLGLNVSGTASGNTIHAEHTLTSSGTLTVVGGATFRSTVAINNVTYSFPAHDGAGSGKVLKSDGAGNLSWADDITVGTGLSIATGDQRYVLKQGDTMSGTLVIDIRNGIQSSIGLKVINTLSGAAIHADKDLTSSGTLTVNGNTRLKSALTILGTLTGNVLHAEKSLSSSGTLVFEGAASGSSLYVATSFDGAGLADCDTAGTSKLLWDATSKRFSCGTDTDTNTQWSGTGALQTAFDNRYVNTSGDTMTGALSVRATLSGSRLVISNNANISGSLLVLNSITTRGTLSGSRLVVSGHANISGSLLVLNGITTRGTLSGANLTVSKSASISGSLLVKTAIASKGSVSGATIFGFGLGSCSGAGQKLSYNNITGVFGCASDVDTNTQFSNTGSLQTAFDARYVNTSGDAMTGALSVRATLSGARLVISNNANISGSLLVLNDITARGTLSGTKLAVSSSATISGALLVKTSITSKGSISGSTLLGFGLGSCNGASQKLLYNSSTNKFECGVVTAAGTFGTGNVITIGDARYVNASGDTMTGALNVRATLSGSRLVISGNANITGALLVQGNITSRGTISGSVLHASATLSSSGGLVFEGSASGSSLYIATSIQGAGLTDCDAATQTLNWDAGTGRFSCGTDLDTDTQFSNTGSLQAAFDARYVNQSGDTMTGALSVRGTLSGARLVISGNANITGALLVLNGITTRGTLSGANLTVSSSASISGALLVKNSITSKGSLSGASFFGAGLGTCNGSTQKVVYDAATGKFGCGTDLNTGSSSSFGTGNVITIGDARYVNTAGDTMTGALSVRGTLSGSRLVVSGNANITGSLLVLNNITSRATISGSVLHASATLSSSGTVVWEGMASGSSLFLGSSLQGAGLTDCTGGNKLLWDATSGRFSCAADQSSGSGLDQNSGDARYVRKSGDTMTGALVLNLTSGYIGLRVINTASGNIIHAEKDLTSSGTLTVNGATRLKSTVTILGTLTGNVLHAEKSLSSSGTLVFEGAASGSSLYVATSFDGAGLLDCDTAGSSKLMWDATSKRFSCGTDQTGGTASNWSNTGSLQTAFDSRYVNTSGDTMTGALSVRATLSGARLVISGNAGITGALLVQGNITTRGTLSGYNLTVSRSASISGTLIVKTGITSKGSVSGATILGFGLGSCNGASQKLLYNSSTNKFECGTISAAGTFSTGNVLTIGDARYVKKSGDTMTGALVINVTNGALGTVGLKVINTFSGAVVHAEKTLTSSGTVVTNSGYLLSAARNQVIRVQTGNGTGKTLSILGASGTGATKGGDIFIEAGSSLVRTYGTAGGATSSGPASPSTTLNNSATGSAAWSSPGNAVTSNDSYASATLIFNSPSQWLTASGFSFAIPSDATINGIVVEVEAKKTQQVQCLPATTPRFRAVKLIKSGTIGGTNNAANTVLTGNLGDEGDCGAPPNTPVDAYYSFGSSSDLWGQSWTYSDINDSKFGFATMFETPATAAGVQVDHMRVTVYYTAGGTSGVAIATAGSTTINAGSGSSPLIIIGNKYSPTVRLVQSGGAVAIGKTTPSGNARLDVFGTISGSRLVISNNAAVSGSLLVQGNIVTRATMSGTRLVVSNNANISGSLVVLNNITARGTLSGSRLIVSGHANISGTLLVLNNVVSRATVSGSNLYAAKSITGTHLYVAQTFGGAGLADCDTAGTSKLLWDSTTKRFSCGTDQTSTFGSGNVITIGDRRYVNTSGDTMTGTLVIQNGNTHVATNAPLLNVRGTMSGRALIISGTGGMPAIYAPNASGSVSLFTRITNDRPMLIVGAQNGNNNYEGGQIRLLGANDDTSYGSTSIDNYRGSFRILNRINGGEFAAVFVGSGGNVGIGSDAPRTKLEVAGTISGSALYVARSFSGAGLTDCDDSTFSKLLWDAATGRFLCGTDQGGSSGISQSTADGRYVNIGGDTMTGGLVIQNGNTHAAASTPLLNVRGTMSGRSIYISGTGTSPLLYGDITKGFIGIGTSNPLAKLDIGGGLRIRGNGNPASGSGAEIQYLNGEGFYNAFADRAAGTYAPVNLEGSIVKLKISGSEKVRLDANGNFGIATTTPKAKLDVVGTISGSRLSISNNANISGSLLVLNNIVARGTISGSTINGFGLGSCNASTQKIVYNSSTNKFECATDLNTGSSSSSTGSLHAAKMTRDAAQTIPSGVATKVLFDAEAYDNGGIADSATNDRFNIAHGGIYMIDAFAKSPGAIDATEYWAVQIRINGNIVMDSSDYSAQTNEDKSAHASDTYRLEAGDYVEMFIVHSEGGDVSTPTETQNKPRMSVVEVGASSSSGSLHIAKMTSAGGQSIPTSAPSTKITFDTENFDVGGIADTSTERFTIARTGKYLVTARVSLKTNDTAPAILAVGIHKNGTIVYESRSAWPGTGYDANTEANTVLSLTAGDYLEMYVSQDSGITKKTMSGSSNSPEMTVTELGVGGSGGGGSSPWSSAGGLVYLNDAAQNVSIGGSTSAETKLEVVGTMSGRNLYISGTGSSPLIATGTGNRIGIGIANPVALLHVRSQSGTHAELRLEATGNTSITPYLSFYTNGAARASIQYRPDTQSGMHFQVNGARYPLETAMSILNNGNVGIGTTAPETKLEVIGTMSGSKLVLTGTSSLIRIMTPAHMALTSQAVNSAFAIYEGSGAVIQFFPNYASGLATLVLGGPDVNNTTKNGMVDFFQYRQLRGVGAYDLELNTKGSTGSAVTRMIVTGNVGTGAVSFINTKVGIGTTTPGGALQIVGGHGAAITGTGVTIDGGDTTTSSDNPRVELRGAGRTPYIDFATDLTTDFGARIIYDSGKLFLGTVVNQVGSRPMDLVITGTGVGIGTTTPRGMLTVQDRTSKGLITLFSPTGTDFDYNGGIDNIFVFTNTTGTGKTAFMGTNFGIGTSYPGSKLSVSGSAIIGRNLGSARANTGVSLEVIGVISGTILNLPSAIADGTSGTGWLTSADSSGVFRDIVGMTSRNATVLNVSNASGGVLKFIYGSNEANTLMTLTRSGSLGIGTTGPKAKLDVIGTISGSRLVISQNANISGALLVVNNITTRRGFSGNTLFINKNATFAGSGIVFTASGGAVFNEQSNNVDFRIESDGNTNMFFVDASADSIGIGKNNPKATLDVLGTISGSLLRIYNGSTSTGAYISQRGNGTALDIISNGTTTDVFNLEARSLTTGMALDVYGSALTTGGLARFYSNSTSALTRSLVSIVNNSSSASRTTPFRILQNASFTGAFIDMNGNAPALDIDSESTTQPGIRIDMPSNHASENPELLFGYNGTFDTNLFRAGPNRLSTSGALLMGSTAFTTVFTDTDADPTTGIGTDYTSEAKTSSGSPISMFTAENPTDEYFYVGLPTKFAVVSFNLAKPGATIVFQAQYYSSAGTWLELPFADGTSNLSQDGSVTFNPPVNWAANAGVPAFPFSNYYVRFHSIATNITRVPTLYSVAPIQQERLTVKSQAGDLRPLFMLNDQNNILVGTTTAALGNAVMTVSGAVIIAPGVTTARIDPKVALEVVGTLSGTRLFVSENATISGSLTIKKTTYMLSGAIISGSLIPGSTNRHDLGTSARRWRDLYLSGGTLYMGTTSNQASIRYNTSASRFGIDANTDGTNELSILSTGNVGVGTSTPKAKLDVFGTISGSRLVLSGNANITGALIAVGNVILGNTSTDTITASGRFISSLMPLVTNTQSFGSNTLRWNSLYMSGSLNLGTSSSNGTITYDTTGTRINMDVNNDGTPEFRFSSAKSIDFAEASSDAPTAAGFARLFARPTSAGGNDGYTTYLVQAEDAGGTAVNTAVGKTSNANLSGSCRSQSAGQAKFGTRSIQFNCSGYQYYRSSTNDDKFTSSDFTVDVWVYEDANTSTKRFLIGETYTTNANQWAMELNASNKLQGQINTSTGKLITFADTTDFPTGQWVHVALERSGSTFRLYRNGTVVATQGHAGNLRSTTSYLMLGAPYPYYTSGYANFTGYMDEIRISKKARYSGSFTNETDAYQLDTGGLYVRLGNGSVVKISGTGGSVDSSSDGAWTVNSDNTIYYQLANVGVGTEAPNAALHVQQDIANGSGALLVRSTVNNGTGAFISTTATGAALLVLNSSEANARSAAIKFGLNDSYDVSLWRSAASTLKTDGSLHVVGDLSGSYLYATNGMRWAIENSNAYAATAADASGLFIEQIGSSVATDTFRLQTSYKGNLSSYSQLFIDPTDGFGFVSTGTGSYKVGIGTRTPESELEVVGTISGSRLIISSAASFSGAVYVKNALRVQSGVVISRAAGAESIRLSDTTNGASVSIRTGTGDPNGTVSAQKGSLFMASDTGKLWRNTNGSTTWTEVGGTGSGALHMTKIVRAAAQAVPSAADAKIYFDTEEYDVGNIADVTPGATGSGRITIRQAGKYLVTGGFYLSTGANTHVGAYIYKNGARTTFARDSMGTQTDSALFVTDTLDLAVGDYIELYARHNGGPGIETSTTESFKPRLSVVQIDGSSSDSIWTSSGSYVYLTNSGQYVGIGLDTPEAGLDVKGNGHMLLRGQYLGDNSKRAGHSEIMTMMTNEEGNNNGYGWWNGAIGMNICWDDNGKNYYRCGTGGVGNSYQGIVFSAADWQDGFERNRMAFILGHETQTGSEVMSLDALGRVGIGTTRPGSALSVSGAVVIGGNIGTSTAKAQLDVKGTISGAGLNVYGATDLFSQQNGTGLTLVHGTVTLYNKSRTEGNVNSVQFRGVTNTGADYLTAAIGVEQHSRNGYAYGDLVFGATNQTGNLGELMRLTGSGDLYIGKTSSSGEFTLQVTETSRTNGYAALFSHVGNSVNNYGIQITNGTNDNSGTNRHINFTDGDGTGVGSITSTDGTVSYNAFTASHYGHATGSFIRGMLVSITGSSLPLYANQQSETVYGFALTQQENDATVLGTYGTVFGLPPVINGVDHYNYGLNDVHLITAMGNGDMWVIGTGGVLRTGDYLISSSVPGYAKKDSATHDVSHIIGRIAKDIDWSTVTDTVTHGGVTYKRARADVLYASFDLAHPQALLNQSSIAVETWGSFGSGILLNTAYTNGNADIFVAKSNVGGTGNTVLRINASGAVFSDSTFNSQGADYAEWFKSTDSSLTAGEVVCIDILNTNAVKRCERGGDTNVMGIVSTNPAFIGNAIRGADGMKGVTGYVLVGLIGQVPAKVVIEGTGGTIRPGDSLTAASLPGYARKARAGESTVGVALEGYDGSTADNVVNVLISRRNQSLTVETVEQKVLESIATMNIGDEVSRLVANASQTLTGSIALTVQSQITSLDIQSQIDASIIRRMSGSLISLADFGSGMTILNTRIAVIESRVAALETALSGSSLHAAAPKIFTGALVLSGSGTRIGNISFSGSEVQIGTLMSTGSLKVMGNVTISGLATFLGNVEVQGQLVLSNKQAGFAVIPMTGTSVTVVFHEPLVATPLITATPQGRVGSEWWVENATLTGFTLRVDTAVSHDVRFTWVATAVIDPVTTMGTGSILPGQTIAFPVDNLGRPLSTDAVWNGCIRGNPPLGGDGQPLSCARYHVDHVWEHPDLHMSFTYNPNHEPSILLLPDGYVVTVIQPQSSSSSSVSSSSSSSSEESSSSSSSSSEPASGSGSTESSESSSASSESSSNSSASSESSSSSVPSGSGSVEAGE